MSLKTWKAEFYPVSARFLVRTGGTMSELVEHSLHKWVGLLPENLNKHAVKVRAGCVHDSADVLELGSDSCALCVVYFDPSVRGRCQKCPLSEARGGIPCDSMTAAEEADRGVSPWCAFTLAGDPEPMIFWLRHTQELLKA